MEKQAYELGILQALCDAGLMKQADLEKMVDLGKLVESLAASNQKATKFVGKGAKATTMAQKTPLQQAIDSLRQSNMRAQGAV